MAKRINELSETTSLNDLSYFAVDGPNSSNATNKVSFKTIHDGITNEMQKTSNAIIHILKFVNNSTYWYRIWSNGWCELGGYTCDESGKFSSNVRYVSRFKCQVSLIVPYVSTDYFLFADAESNYNNYFGNCGYDYVDAHSKTTTTFRLIMCNFTGSGSALDHYFRQYWEAKGMVDLSKI